MAKINFTNNAGPSTDRKMQSTPAKYRESKGRPNISQSDGIRPAFPLMPFAHLPVSFTDVTTTDAVVIPKGRIVSAITSNGGVDAGGDMDGSVYYGVGKGIMGLMVPANGGDARAITSPVDAATKTISANAPIGIVEHDVYQDINGDNLNYDMRNKNWGVLSQQLIKIPAVDTFEFDKFTGEVSGFLPVDASGTDGGQENVAGSVAAETVQFNAAAGTTATFNAATGFLASSYDIVSITVDGFIQDATVIANSSMADSGAISIVGAEGCSDAAGTTEAACVLLGVCSGGSATGNEATEAECDAVAGTTWTAETWGALTGNPVNRTVSATYTYDFDNAGTGAPAAALSGSMGYTECEKKFSFLTYNSEAGEGLAGMPVAPDFYGNFKEGAATKDAQTVGLLMGIDYRFGKDMLDTVQSKWEDDAEFATAGTRTKGIPQFLYDFAYAALNGYVMKKTSTWDAVWPGKDAAVVIKDAVDAGVFGEAWIQVNI